MTDRSVYSIHLHTAAERPIMLQSIRVAKPHDDTSLRLAEEEAFAAARAHGLAYARLDYMGAGGRTIRSSRLGVPEAPSN